MVDWRMHDHSDLAGRQIEQTASLDHFKALIHQSGRIDSNAASHFPGGMVQRLFDGDVGELEAGVFRNGPPDAVSHTRSTSLMRPPRRHWWTALCSLSIRKQRFALALSLGG